jgi:hypothetical protein
MADLALLGLKLQSSSVVKPSRKPDVDGAARCMLGRIVIDLIVYPAEARVMMSST